MRSTGVSRSIDSLGRVVIPKEIRKKMRIREADLLEFYTGEDGEIVLKKYSPMEDLSDTAKQYAESLAQVSGYVAVITDRDNVIAVSGGCKNLMGEHISKELERTMDDRRVLIAQRGTRDFIPVTGEDGDDILQEGVVPIICQGDVTGAVLLLNKERRGQIGEAEKKLLQSAASFLGRQMELV